jgi:hypothetical protein
VGRMPRRRRVAMRGVRRARGGKIRTNWGDVAAGFLAPFKATAHILTGNYKAIPGDFADAGRRIVANKKG